MGARWFRSRRGNAEGVRVELPNGLDAEASSSIDLPDLDDDGTDDIQQTNLKAEGALFFAALLEKMRLLLPFGRRKECEDDS